VFGSGFYTEPTLTPEILAASAEQIADILIRDVTTGIDGSEIKAGMIGEIGTSDPIGPGEETVLRGAAIAQRETGVALNVHLQELGGNGLQILDRIDEAGGDLSRVVLSHLDSRMDLTYHEALARRGAYVEYDCFGIEEYREREACWSPTDRERVEGVCRLVERGYGRQILLSTDVCMKTQLLRYGGPGYAHVPDNVVPMLLRAGLDQATVDVLMRENPARVLALEP
jgi:phosphotriesterase-related protein